MFRMEAGAAVGDFAPELALRDTVGDPVKLTDFRRKANVPIAFYRGEADQYSTRWLAALRDDYLEIRALDAEVPAISADSLQAALDAGGRYRRPVPAAGTGCRSGCCRTRTAT